VSVLRVLVPSLAASLLLTASSALAAPQYAVEVTASRLNVRSGVWGSVLGSVGRGDRFAVTGSRSGWLRVDYAGRSAWISGDYARRVPATAAEVTASALNVRSGPSTGSRRVGLVRSGQAYVQLGTSRGWARIQYADGAGWVSGRYVRTRSLGSSGGGGATTRSTPRRTTPTSSGSGLRNPPMNATDYELEVLARICKGEAGVASYENKVAVCAVVLNRVRDRRWPNTIPGVAHQPWQFSAYNANVRDRLYWGPIPSDCWRAAREALAGRDPSRGATHYFNPFLVLPSWARNMTFLVRIGSTARDAHDFYR